MKKTLSSLFIFFLLFPLISLAETTPAENADIVIAADKKLYEENIGVQPDTNSKIAPTKKSSLFDTKSSSLKKLKTLSQSSQKLDVNSTKRTIKSFSPELIVNGNFEYGQTAWTGSSKGYDGNYFDSPSVMVADGNGYGSWHAYISESSMLESQPFTLPINANYLGIAYDARFVHWGTCSYGTNGVYVFVWDETTDELVQGSFAHDAYTDSYDYDYYTQLLTTTISISSRAGHKLSLNFQGTKSDPSCTFALYLDNVSLQANTTDVCTGNTCTSHRFRNLQDGRYLYSSDPSEMNNIVANLRSSWVDEGSSFKVLTTGAPGTLTAHRFRNLQNGRYLFSADPAEISNINANLRTSWADEGPSFAVAASSGAGTTPAHRFRSLIDGRYLVSADPAEISNINANLRASWVDEGIAFYLPL